MNKFEAFYLIGLLLGLAFILTWTTYLEYRRPKPPRDENGRFTFVDSMPWSKPFGRRCKARLKRGQDPQYHGRCDLAPHDYYFDHCLERGMDWVRWHERTGIRYEGPTYKKVRH